MKPTPVNTDSIRIRTTGIQLRRQDRERKVDYIRRVTDQSIREFLPGLAIPDVEYRDYERDLSELASELRTWSKNAYDLKIARAHLARVVHQHNRQHGTRLPIPPPLSRLYPDTLLRSQRWSESRRALNRAHERWLRGLDTRIGINLSVELRLGQLLYVAATYGGLCIPAAIESLRSTMGRSRPIEYCHRTGLHWIDLYYVHGNLTNVTRSKEDLIYQPWILTKMCKLTAFGFLAHRNRFGDVQPAERRDTFDLIKSAFAQVAGTELPFPSLSKFLRVAFCVAERQPGAEMTELHAEYSIGRVPSACLRPPVWRHMLATSNDYSSLEIKS